MNFVGITLVFGLFLFGGVNGQCILYMIADNSFVAYLDGVHVAGGDNYAKIYPLQVPASGGVLTVELSNSDGASGLFITSNDEVYTSSGTTKCIKKSDLYLNANNLTAYRFSTYSNTHWPNAVDVSGNFNEGIDTAPWDQENFDVALGSLPPTDDAEFIWNANPGYNLGNRYGKAQTDGDMSVVCRMTLDTNNCASVGTAAGNSGSSKIETTEPCLNGVIVDGGRHCLKVYDGLYTWEEARQAVAGTSRMLAFINDHETNEAVKTLMGPLNSNANNIGTNAWVGMRSDYKQAGPWVYGSGVAGTFSTYEAYDQGCYTDNSAKRNLLSTPFTSEAGCLSMCNTRGDMYAGIKATAFCACISESNFESFVATDNCTYPCASDANTRCYHPDKFRIHRYNGIQSAKWDSVGAGQPNNFNDEGQWCAAIEGDTVADLRCGQQRRYVCELPLGANDQCASITNYKSLKADSRCYYLAGLVLETNWYRAQNNCVSLGGQLASPVTEKLFNSTRDFIKTDATNINNGDVWIHLHREAFYSVTGYNSGSNDLSTGGKFRITEEYNNFAGVSIMTDLQQWECVYFSCSSDQAVNCVWKTGGCNSNANKYNYITIEQLSVTTTTATTTTTTTQKPNTTTTNPPTTTITHSPTTTPSTTTPTTTSTTTPKPTTTSTTQIPVTSSTTTQIPVTSSSTTQIPVTSSTTTHIPVTSSTTATTTSSSTTQLMTTSTHSNPVTNNVASTKQNQAAYTAPTAISTKTPEVTTAVPPTAAPTAATTASPTEAPVTTAGLPPAAAASTSSQLSGVMIALIVVILLILLAIIIAIIVFCCCFKNNKSAAAVGPRKYNARPIAHLPISTKLGEEESGIFVVESEQGSTTNLVADPNSFNGPYKSPRYQDEWGY